MQRLGATVLLAMCSSIPALQIGVNLGGWLVMEPTMYDQPILSTSNAELDVVTKLRKSGDAFALQTMQNHWSGFVSEAILDILAASGVTHVRIPVGYWMFDAPTTGGTMRDYGFQDEGFATGAINALEAMLPYLDKRGIRVLLDNHALPGCSARCQGFAGMYCAEPAFFFGRPNQSIAGCNGGPSYLSSRDGSKTWFDLGQQYLKRIAAWITSNPVARRLVFAITIMNEPGIGEVYSDQIRWFYDGAGWSLPQNVSVAANFVGSSFSETTGAAFVRHAINTGAIPPSAIVDYHHYYNWNGVNKPDDYKAMVCNSTEAWWSYRTYAGLPTVIGEWSLAVNYNENLRNLSKPSDVAFMKLHYANQASYYATMADGLYFWNFRMGSGWDPRPSAQHPAGRQLPGTAADTSLPTYKLTSWSYLELLRHKIVVPLSSLNITGRCRCIGCAPPT